jgi:hypothetical protein
MGILSLQENGNTLLTSSAMESMKIKCVAEIDKNLPSLAGDAALVSDNRINSSQNATKIGMKLPHGHNIKPRFLIYTAQSM